jgi:hypothetical protein
MEVNDQLHSPPDFTVGELASDTHYILDGCCEEDHIPSIRQTSTADFSVFQLIA